MDAVFAFLIQLIVEFWGVFSEMAPYLLLGFGVAGLLSVFISPERVERHLGGRGLLPTIKAAVLGVPLPLCSCGVIPVSASLRRHGAGRGATASFLLSTPQTGMDSILVTYGLLGGVFAIYRPIVALLSGIFGGVLVSLAGAPAAAKAEEQAAQSDPCREACCSEEGGNRWMRSLRYGFVILPEDIGRALLVGVGIAALLTAVLDPGMLAPYLGSGPLAILVMMALGIPIYVCATASVPVAFALIVQGGVSAGAGFAFLVTGPATNAATLAVLWRVLGPRTALIYLFVVAATAFGGGLLLDQFLAPESIRQAVTGHEMLPGLFNHLAGVALLAVLGYALWPGRPHHAGHEQAHEHEHPAGEEDATAAPAEAGQRAVIDVRGMTCNHCANSVQRALLESPGVQEATVDLPAGAANVAGKGLDFDRLRQAVQQLGYDVPDVRWAH